MSCQPERVTGYVDEALTAEERSALEAHLGSCPACTLQAASERELRRRLRSLADEPLPAGLLPAVRAALFHAPPRRRLWPALLPLAASLVLFAFWLRGEPAFAAWAMARDHAHCFGRPKLPARVWSGEPDRIADWFERQGTPVPRLPAGARGLGLIGARYCTLADGSRAPHVYYASGASQVSLFVVRDEVRVGAVFEGRSRGLHVRMQRVGGHVIGLVGEQEQDVEALRGALSVSVARALLAEPPTPP